MSISVLRKIEFVIEKQRREDGFEKKTTFRTFSERKMDKERNRLRSRAKSSQQAIVIRGPLSGRKTTPAISLPPYRDFP